MTKKDFNMIADNLRVVCVKIKTRSEQKIFDDSIIQLAKSFESLNPRFNKFLFAKKVYSLCPEENPLAEGLRRSCCGE